jgi:hypothetical protein
MKETSDVALQIQSDLRPVTARTTRTKLCMIAAVFAVAVSVVIGIPFAVIFLKPRPAYLQRQSRFSSAALHPGLLNPTAAPSYPVSGTIRQQVHIPASASPSEDRLLHMEYEAVVNDQMTIFALDHEASVVDVGCFDGAFHLRLDPTGSASAPTFEPGHVVTGSHQWGCTGADAGVSNSTAVQAILFRVVSVWLVPAPDATVSMVVEEVGVHELFRSLTVHYVNTLPSNVTVVHITDGESAPTTAAAAAAAAAAPTGGRRRLGWWSRLKHHVDDDAAKVRGDVKKVGHDVSEVYHGDYDPNVPMRALKTFSWVPPSSVHVGPVDAKGSKASVQVGLGVHMNIHDWKLQTANISAVLTPDITANADLSLPATLSKTYSKELIKPESLGSIDFAIGPVPIHASALLGLSLHASVHADAVITLKTGAGAKIKPSTFGVSYARDQGWSQVKHVLSDATTMTHQPPTLTAAAGATASLSVVPSLSLNVDYLGGPTVQAVPTLDFRVQAPAETVSKETGAQESAVSGCAANQLKGTLSWGLDVSVSAKLSLKLPGVLKKLDRTFANWGPKTVYSMPNKQLESKCVSL